MLGIIEDAFKSESLQFSRLDGSMSQSKREKALMKFINEPKVTILLASLKATGVGLNLVVANHIYLVDPWWNAAIESQAIDRVHRIGQTKSVHVTRYIIRDSVEEKMLAIQKSKQHLQQLTESGGVDLETLMKLI